VPWLWYGNAWRQSHLGGVLTNATKAIVVMRQRRTGCKRLLWFACHTGSWQLLLAVGAWLCCSGESLSRRVQRLLLMPFASQ
jgi:hypothetical protein